MHIKGIKLMKNLIDIKDIFENDRIIVMETEQQKDGQNIYELSVGIKDDNGDIVEIVDLI